MKSPAAVVESDELSCPVTTAGVALLYITKGIDQPSIIRNGRRNSTVLENYSS